MEKNTENKNKSNSETTPFNMSIFSKLQYIKIIFVGTNKEIHEMRVESHSVNNDSIQLHINSKEFFDITCPTGVVLKFVTIDAIHFTKTILNDIKKVGDKYIFILDIPQKTIRQQNRRYYRVNIDRPCVLLVNDNNNNTQTYIAQSVNISKGGVLLYNVESALSDKEGTPPLLQCDSCHIAIFLEQDLRVKSYSKFVRMDSFEGSYRYAFQFINMQKKYIIPFDRYLTNEELKLLKFIKNK